MGGVCQVELVFYGVGGRRGARSAPRRGGLPLDSPQGRVRTVRLSTLPCQVSLISPPNRMCDFHRVQLSSFPLAWWPRSIFRRANLPGTLYTAPSFCADELFLAILLSIANSIFGSCTMCSSYTLDNRKTCWPSPCTRLSRAPWTGRHSYRLLRQLRCPSDFQALSAIAISGAQTGAIPV